MRPKKSVEHTELLVLSLLSWELATYLQDHSKVMMEHSLSPEKAGMGGPAALKR